MWVVDEILHVLFNKRRKSSTNDCFGVYKLCFWAKKISTFFRFRLAVFLYEVIAMFVSVTIYIF